MDIKFMTGDINTLGEVTPENGVVYFAVDKNKHIGTIFLGDGTNLNMYEMGAKHFKPITNSTITEIEKPITIFQVETPQTPGPGNIVAKISNKLYQCSICYGFQTYANAGNTVTYWLPAPVSDNNLSEDNTDYEIITSHQHPCIMQSEIIADNIGGNFQTEQIIIKPQFTEIQAFTIFYRTEYGGEPLHSVTLFYNFGIAEGQVSSPGPSISIVESDDGKHFKLTNSGALYIEKVIALGITSHIIPEGD